MSQTGYTPIQLYRTSTSGASPTSGNLTAGELAINYNTADMSVWALNTGGSVIRLMNNPAGLKYPTTDGTANQVMVTNGSGVLSWAAGPSGVYLPLAGGTMTGAITFAAGQFGTNVNTFLSTPSSANLAAALTDETGTGSAVFANAPTFPAQINLTANSGYNIYASGTANNYLASNLGIGANAGNIGGLSGYISMIVGADLTGSTNATGIWQSSQVKSGVTNAAYGFRNSGSTQAATFTLPLYAHFSASTLTIGAGSTVAVQYGFRVSDLNGASVNIGFSGGVTAGTGKYNLSMSGDADNLLNGPLGIGTAAPADASAMLEVKSTTKGVRFPNMTTTQKNAIATPAAGLVVFDTTLSKLCVYSGSAWQTITSV
jgi:hypothetical protein